jgi:hypothetical protein
MKIEDILDEWGRDVEIDRTELGEESLKIPKLHHKYLKIMIHEKMRLRKLEYDMKALKLEKYEFFSQGPTKEQKEAGWVLPAKGIVLKQEVPMYLEADKEIVDMSIKIGVQQEKVELLESIMKTIMNRNFILKNAIDFVKFTAGN